MTNDDKIKDKKLQYEKQQEYQHYHKVKLINMNILKVKKCYDLIKLE